MVKIGKGRGGENMAAGRDLTAAAEGPDPDLDLIWRTVSLGAICGRLLAEKQFAERGKVCAVRVSSWRVSIKTIDDAVDEFFLFPCKHAAVVVALLLLPLSPLLQPCY